MRVLIKGIPSNAGALNVGTELAPKLLREAGLVSELGKRNEITDLGDVQLPQTLVRHNIAPVRNWPSPRIVWEETKNQLESCFERDSFTVILGGGCSVFTGVFNKFYQMYGSDAQIITVDHHIDVRKPNTEICMGATAYTLWFLTENNQWFTKPEQFSKERIIALGYDDSTIDENYDISGIQGFSMHEIYHKGVEAIVKSCYEKIGKNAKVLIHLDLDVIKDEDLQSVYMPSPNGMDFKTVQDMLKGLVKDPRVLGIVVTEFSGAYDTSEADAKKVVDLIVGLYD